MEDGKTLWGVWSEARGQWVVRPDGVVFGTDNEGYAQAQARALGDYWGWPDARVRSFGEGDFRTRMGRMGGLG